MQDSNYKILNFINDYINQELDDIKNIVVTDYTVGLEHGLEKVLKQINTKMEQLRNINK